MMKRSRSHPKLSEVQHSLDVPEFDPLAPSKEGFLIRDEERDWYLLVGYVSIILGNMIPDASQEIQACYEEIRNSDLSKRLYTHCQMVLIKAKHQAKHGRNVDIGSLVEDRKLGLDLNLQVEAWGNQMLVPWVEKWACGSRIMLLWLKANLCFDLVRSGLDISEKDLGKGGALYEALTSITSQFFKTKNEDMSWCWKVLVDPNFKKSQQNIRKQARGKIKELDFDGRIRENRLLLMAWCWVMYRVLGRKLNDIADELYSRFLNETCMEVNKSEQSIHLDYIKPVDRAMFSNPIIE